MNRNCSEAESNSRKEFVDFAGREKDLQEFERNEASLTNYLKESWEKINDKTTTLLDLQYKKSNLKDLKVQLTNLYNTNYVDFTGSLFPAFPELNIDFKQLLEQKLEEIRRLIESVSQKIEGRKIKEQIDATKQEAEAKSKQAIQGKDYNTVLAEIKGSENKFWKGLPMEVVVKHFEVLTTKPNNAKEPFLTKEQFVSFLKRGFLDDRNQPIQKINCTSGEKGFVIKRFYELFALAASQYSHPQRKESFINLFVDCFDNWKFSSIKPFFKPNKTKKNWE